MVYTAQSAGDPCIIQCHNNVFCFHTVSFLGIFNTRSGFFITTEHCADVSMELSITASVWVLLLKSSNQLRAHHFRCETGTVFFRHTILHLSTLLFIFILQPNQSHKAPLSPALPRELSENCHLSAHTRVLQASLHWSHGPFTFCEFTPIEK